MQRRQNAFGARLFLARVCGRADENTLAAGRVAGTLRVVRTVDGDGVDGRLDARMAVHIEMRLVGLALGLEQQWKASSEMRRRPRADPPSPACARADPYRPRDGRCPARGGFTVNRPTRAPSSSSSTCVRFASGLRRVRCGRAPGAPGSRTRRRAGRCSGATVPPRVPRGSSSKCSSWVRSGGRLTVSPPGDLSGAADREPADLPRGGEIAFEQRGREVADGDVVEAVAGIVAGQQRGDVDVERQQIADGVLIFGAIEAAEGVGAAGVGVRSGGPVEGGFELGDERVVSGLVRTRQSGRRHGTDAQPAHHLLPDLRVCGRLHRRKRRRARGRQS